VIDACQDENRCIHFSNFIKRNVRQAMMTPTRVRSAQTSPKTIAIAASGDTIQELGNGLAGRMLGTKRCKDARLSILLAC
jgi:hypothetical protein